MQKFGKRLIFQEICTPNSSLLHSLTINQVFLPALVVRISETVRDSETDENLGPEGYIGRSI